MKFQVLGANLSFGKLLNLKYDNSNHVEKPHEEKRFTQHESTQFN